MSDWETFFASNPAPSDLNSTEVLIKNFVKRHSSTRPICLVTSGLHTDTYFILLLLLIPNLFNKEVLLFLLR